MEIYQNYWNNKKNCYEFIKLDMSKSEVTDFEAAAVEYLESYLNKKFPKELRNNYAESIALIKGGFWAGVGFVKLFYCITRK